MADSKSKGIGCFCFRPCSCCQGSECNCSRCKNCWNNYKEFVKRKFIALSFFALGCIGLTIAFLLIEDPDWNITIVPYLCTIVACALMSVTCKRGYYDRKRVVYACPPQASKRPAVSEDFVEFTDSEVSPLLSSAGRNGQHEKINLCVMDCRLAKEAEELFEPSPAILRG